MEKIGVGVLGATGLVGQTIVQLLSDHPWFEVKEVAASERSAGRKYGEVMESRWGVSDEVPENVKDLVLKECKPHLDCEVVLSALDSSVATEVEERFAEAGYVVSSNAKNHRMDEDVPLLIPEVNGEHISIIENQRRVRGWKGLIVTNPNCSVMGLALALKPIHDAFGVKKVVVTTMQAVSGAGYPGVPSMDILGNVVPFIGDEEEKIESETPKILGNVAGDRFDYADMKISAQCNRVPVLNGHMESVSIKLSKKAKKEEIITAIERFAPLKQMSLPLAPARPVSYLRGMNRPQPKLDVDAEGGMGVSIGRLRECSILDYKFTLLSHNLVRGAAGAAVLNAEFLKAKGYV